jgi:uncharacterized membrane-anchored protein
MRKRSTVKIKRHLILLQRQHQELEELAKKSPELDYSGIVRIVVDLGLAQVRRSEAARQLIMGEMEALLAE